MVRWMCDVKVKDRVPSKELRERLGIDDRLRWYGHVLRKEDTDWVKKCMEYEVEGSGPRGRPKRTWREVVQKDCQAHNLNREDAMDRSRWNHHHTTPQPFYSPFSRSTRVSECKKKTSGLNGARED